MADKKVLVADSITVGELAETLHLQVSTLVGELFKNGIVATRLILIQLKLLLKSSA